MVSLDGLGEALENIRIAPVTRLQLEIMGTPSGSSRNASVAIFMPFKTLPPPSLRVPIELQAIDGRIVLIAGDGLLCGLG